MNTNDTGYHKAHAQSLSLVRVRTHQHVIFFKSTSFGQPQSKCLLLFFQDKIKSYMESLSVKLPLPVKCTIEERKGR
jgi:hypothetical protein